MAENREYKSDVFSMLMGDKENALQVYNALNGSSYTDPDRVEIGSLERGVSLSIRNDAAFIVDMNLSIYEHQSTYNPNMSLRALLYFVSYLRRMIENRDLFSSHMIRIPTPHFAVFYNGLEDRPEREVIRLSASYENPTDRPELELICTVYNINPNKDKNLLNGCSVLNEYTQFVESVRRFEEADPEISVSKAIDYCISNHILEDFLRKNRAEVLKVMTIDMTFERREALFRKEERELGHEEGLTQGRIEDIKNLMKNMHLGAKDAMAALGIEEEECEKYLNLLNKDRQ